MDSTKNRLREELVSRHCICVILSGWDTGLLPEAGMGVGPASYCMGLKNNTIGVILTERVDCVIS